MTSLEVVRYHGNQGQRSHSLVFKLPPHVVNNQNLVLLAEAILKSNASIFMLLVIQLFGI